MSRRDSFDYDLFVDERDEMFIRDLATRVAKGVELRFTLITGDAVVGFPSGLDEDYIKVTASSPGNPAAWINRRHILLMEETGVVPIAKHGFDDEARENIEWLSKPLRKKAVLARKGSTTDD